MKERKKILLLGKLPPPFMGPSVAFNILINSELKNEFHLCYLDIKVNESLTTLGKWSIKKTINNFSKYIKLVSLLRTESPDVTLIPISQSSVGFIKDSIFILLASIFRTRILIQLRGGNFKNWLDQSSGMMNNYVKFVLSKTSGVIALGQNLKHLFEAYYSNDKIFVVPNGGNFNSYKNNKHDSDSVRLIYIGNLQSSKGIIDVIEAIKLLNKLSQTKFSLDVIGAWRDDTTKNECNRLVNENNLPVEFFNNMHGPEKLDMLFQSDIFIFTPREPEGHPWVVIEAMAAGLPIIATDQGAICESVQDRVNGFIVPVKDPESISAKLKILIEDSASRKEMGLISRKLYLDKFTEEKMINNYIKVFNRVAEM